MRKSNLTTFISLALLCVTFAVSACGDNEVYDQELSVDISSGYGNVNDKWLFKYPKSLKYDESLDGAYFVDVAIMRMLANDPEGWGYGCYCAFKTLTQPDLLANDKQDYVNASAIMLRRMESECFPGWLDDNFESKIYELQKNATERILSKSGYEVTDWEAEKQTVINGINVYVYTYSATKLGLETKHKVACLIKDKFVIELSVRASPEEYKLFESKFDKILATAQLVKIEDAKEINNLNEEK